MGTVLRVHSGGKMDHARLDYSVNIMPSDGHKKTTVNLLLQALFVIWVIIVNILYFHQFKNLLAMRFTHILHRWH